MGGKRREGRRRDRHLGPLGCPRLPGPRGAHSEGLCTLPHAPPTAAQRQGQGQGRPQGAGGSLAPYSSARVRKSGPQSSSGSVGPGTPPASLPEPRELSEPQEEPRPS